MKKVGILLGIGLVMLGCGSATEVDEKKVSVTQEAKQIVLPPSKAYPVSENPEPIEIYPFKSAKFAFQIDEPGIKRGSLSVFIDGYGNLETKRSQKTLENDTIITNWTIKRGLDIFSIHPETQDVINAKLSERESASIDLKALKDRYGSDETVQKWLADQGITLLPDEIIQGYPCQVYQKVTNGYTVTRWVYQGVELQMSVESEMIPKMITRSLISAEFDCEIPAELFEYPETFKIRQRS